MGYIQDGFKAQNGLYSGRFQGSEWAIFRPVSRLIMDYIQAGFKAQNGLYSGRFHDSE
jgi:hypothetical protein